MQPQSNKNWNMQAALQNKVYNHLNLKEKLLNE